MKRSATSTHLGEERWQVMKKSASVVHLPEVPVQVVTKHHLVLLHSDISALLPLRGTPSSPPPSPPTSACSSPTSPTPSPSPQSPSLWPPSPPCCPPSPPPWSPPRHPAPVPPHQQGGAQQALHLCHRHRQHPRRLLLPPLHPRHLLHHHPGDLARPGGGYHTARLPGAGAGRISNKTLLKICCNF